MGCKYGSIVCFDALADLAGLALAVLSRVDRQSSRATGMW
jgi:hypothetical protein